MGGESCLKFFISDRSSEAAGDRDQDLIRLCTGRFASYLEREVPVKGMSCSLYVNYTAIPEGYMLIGICFDEMFNSLLVGSDRDMLDVARKKYSLLNGGLSVYESLSNGAPDPGKIWMGMDRDPNDGAEICVASSLMPIPQSCVRDADALCREVKSAQSREITSKVLEYGFNLLEEVSDPIHPIRDVARHMNEEFRKDMRDPKKALWFAAKTAWRIHGFAS